MRLIGYIATEGKSSKLVLLDGAAHSQLALVSQLTVATIFKLRSQLVAPDDRKIEWATRLGALDVPRRSAHKAKEFFRKLDTHTPEKDLVLNNTFHTYLKLFELLVIRLVFNRLLY